MVVDIGRIDVMRVEGSYFDFLCSMLDGKRVCHDLLLRHLHSIEFYSFVPNDDNRGEDGKKLRDMFKAEMGGAGLTKPCTVLEMLIGLSFRMEGELEGSPEALRMDECFWTLIENLDLWWCNDGAYYPDDGSLAVDECTDRLLKRTYKRDGKGGLFPLDRTRNDQRKVEIWYQMAEYLLEKFEF